MDWHYATSITIPELYHIFWGVFGDYKIQFTMKLDQFEALLDRSSYSAECSFGIFDNNQLVGFMLNGLRERGSFKECYGIAAGMIPEYRNKDYKSAAMTSTFFKQLKKMGMHSFKCEVMRENLPMVAFMRRAGGCVNRPYVNYRGEIKALKLSTGATEEIGLKEEMNFDFLLGNNAMPVQELAWQNTQEAILGRQKDFHILSAVIDGIVVGYGVINTVQGDIPQLIVSEAYSNIGIGTRLLYELVQKTHSTHASFYGVGEDLKQLIEFIENRGFQEHSRDYEIVKMF